MKRVSVQVWLVGNRAGGSTSDNGMPYDSIPTVKSDFYCIHDARIMHSSTAPEHVAAFRSAAPAIIGRKPAPRFRHSSLSACPYQGSSQHNLTLRCSTTHDDDQGADKPPRLSTACPRPQAAARPEIGAQCSKPSKGHACATPRTSFY